MGFGERDDGLKQSWNNNVVFCNPPYGTVLKHWVKKASEAQGGVVVMLIPARTDTQYFHNYIYQKENVEIRFLKGRLKFGGSSNSAPFPSMVVIFR
jgi:site-specific DNA-methyltransferase (adenine-specific)